MAGETNQAVITEEQLKQFRNKLEGTSFTSRLFGTSKELPNDVKTYLAELVGVTPIEKFKTAEKQLIDLEKHENPSKELMRYKSELQTVVDVSAIQAERKNNSPANRN